MSFHLEASQSTAHRVDHPSHGQIGTRYDQHGPGDATWFTRTIHGTESCNRSQGGWQTRTCLLFFWVASIDGLRLVRPKETLLLKSYLAPRRTPQKWRGNYVTCDSIKIQERKRTVVLAKVAAIRRAGGRFHRILGMLLTLDHRQLFLPQGSCPSEQSDHCPRPSRLPGDRR
jgi:hypothetical protein